MKTLLVAGADLGSVQGAFSFWEAKQTVIKGAIKEPQGFSIDNNKKEWKTFGVSILFIGHFLHQPQNQISLFFC